MKTVIKKKTVDYEVLVAYDGMEFSVETFGSIDKAREECKKYENSAKGIIASKAMKVLKPYIVPGSDKLSLDNVPEETKKSMPKWRQGLFDPANLTVHCIASQLLTANWSCLADTCTAVYTFKPKEQSDIDIVAQYCEIIKAPVHEWVYKEKDYYSKDLVAILNHYSVDCLNIDSIKVGHTYIVIVVPDNEVTCVIDIENVISLWTDLLKDVKENY